MSIIQRIRWGRVAAAGAALALVFVGGSLLDDDLSAHSSAPGGDISALDAEPAKPGDTALLANRVWIDHMPRSQRDMTTQAIFVDKDGQKIGIVRRASTWRHIGEMFRWDARSSGGLTITFPQIDKSVPLNARAWACKDAPKGFDLCMEVSLLGKKARLYSNKKWNLTNTDLDATDLDAVVSGLITFDPDAVDASSDDEALFEAVQTLD